MPYATLALDIETAGGRPEDAERDMRTNWSPSPNWKAETIGNRYLEMLEKKKERLALIDGSAVISDALIGVDSTGARSIGCFHSLYSHEPKRVEAADVFGFVSERDALYAKRTMLDANCDPDTCLVGHNIIEFDLPKLRMAYLRHGLQLPHVLASQYQPVFDTMREWGKRFSATRNPFISVADVLEVLGIESHKSLVDGSQVEQLYKDGRHDTIIKYNLLDVIVEHDLFLRMTGQHPDGQAANQQPAATPTATETTNYATDPSEWGSEKPQVAPHVSTAGAA